MTVYVVEKGISEQGGGEQEAIAVFSALDKARDFVERRIAEEEREWPERGKYVFDPEAANVWRQSPCFYSIREFVVDAGAHGTLGGKQR